MSEAHVDLTHSRDGGGVDTGPGGRDARGGGCGGEGPAERRRRTGETGTNSATFEDRTETQELRDLRRMREGLRSMGFPVQADGTFGDGDRDVRLVDVGHAAVGGGGGGG